MRIMLFVIKFFLLGAFFIIGNQNLALSHPENRQAFITQYQDWIYDVASNLNSLTGYIVRVEWLPQTGEKKENVIESSPRYSKVKG